MNDPNEEIPLLSRPKQQAPTPLPKLQLSIIMIVQICGPLASQSIYPYINQLISELDITGGDKRKVGYYACFTQESLFFVTQALTVFQWSRASDYVGRKPIILIGLFGTTLSMICFGLSRTFWALLYSSAAALLEFSTETLASIFSTIILATFGALLGGHLSRPHERFPRLFSAVFWKEFPYFLPCAATGSFVFMSWFVVLFFFKETVPRRSGRQHPCLENNDLSTSGSPYSPPPSRNGPLPLRQLLGFPVIISVSNYVTLAFLNTTLGALLPLFFAMPIDIGGLGLPPSKIGMILALYGAATGLLQVFFFAKLIRRILAQRGGLSIIVWILVGCVLALDALMDTSFGAIFMFVTASAPKSSRGSVNGLSQTTVALSRAIGPAMSTSLFSLSVQHNILGGYGVYAILFALSIFALMVAKHLPEEMWEEVDE
ncbi:major facilitator superfamily domain-containing protein [Mycena rebaudengoi]|nr:major facilitator superfamily domain-containing protein [Mycena rebaudengoi]